MKRAELRHRERIAALEKGIELPPEPGFEPGSKRAGSLKSGLMGLFVGVVLYFALRAVADDDVALFGLIPTAVGIANLIAYFVESKKDGNGNGDAAKRDAVQAPMTMPASVPRGRVARGGGRPAGRAEPEPFSTFARP